jgi:2-methylisocitrate lyase-like PEP mutase family enzyme
MFHLGTSQAEVDAEREKLVTAWGPAARRVEGGALLCTPAEAVDRINAYKEAGADMINIALRAPWNEEALNAYLDEVIPAVKG